jgi:hypothetical protein
MNPFDFVNSINNTKKNLIRECEDGSITEKDYSSFLINKALSYFPDTLLYANEMNMNPHLDGLMQYEYLLNGIRPGKRFSKWVKSDLSDDIKAVSTYFKVNLRIAEEYARILSPNEIKEIKELINNFA